MAGTIWRRRARLRGFEAFAAGLATRAGSHSSFHAQGKGRPVGLTLGPRRLECISNKSEPPGRNLMGLAIATASFECAIDGGLAHIVLNQPDAATRSTATFAASSAFAWLN